MSLILLNLQSNQQIKLHADSPLTIGRGNVEGCFDKRVSRSHGRVTCSEDGKIHIVALHTNPCFITRNGVPPILRLNKNEEEILKKGDCLGLLPDEFWFQVVSENEIQPKNRGSESNISNEIKTENGSEENNIISSNSEETVSPVKVEHVSVKNEYSPCKNTTTNVETKLSSQPSTSSAETIPSTSRPELEKTRKLPIWMYEIDEPKRSDKSPNKHSSQCDDKYKVKKPKLSLDKEESENNSIKVEYNTDLPSTSNSINDSELPSTTVKTEDTMTQVDGEGSEQNKEKDGYESDVVNNMPDNPARRPYCQYEGTCYRKNPQHKVDYCHPGDADYLPYEERPLCQYGAVCYRRNESHRIEYRHPPPDTSAGPLSSASSCSCGSRGEERPPCEFGSSCRHTSPKHRKEFYHPPKVSSPLPAKRRRKKVKRQNSDYEDEDEYDLDDPFIDDASSDEYLPSGSASEVEELDSFQDD